MTASFWSALASPLGVIAGISVGMVLVGIAAAVVNAMVGARK